MYTIGIADTTFSRVNMTATAMKVLKRNLPSSRIIRYTVPGVKDLPVACLRLFDQGCDIVMAFGWAGKMPVDKMCSHEASTAIQQVQLMTRKHVLEVFVHEDEDKNEKKVKEIALNRSSEHALNAVALLKNQTVLTKMAGTGQRQGRKDAGAIK